MFSVLRIFIFFAVTFVAGLFICALHIPLLPLRWLKPRWYQLANIFLTSHFWPVLPYLYLKWGRGKINIYGDALRKESKSLLFANHQDSRDWLVGFCLAYHSDAIGGMKCIMKNTLAVLPVFGWLMFLCDFPFIKRNETSLLAIQAFCKKMVDYPVSLWFCLFPEGTRFSPSKLKAAKQWCEEKKIKPFQRVLVPRVGGFHSALEALRSSIDMVCDVTIMYDRKLSQNAFLQGRGDSITHVIIRSIPISRVPEAKAEVAEFLMHAFRVKDDAMAEFETSKGRDMSKVLKIALGSSVSAKQSLPTEISFSGHQFHMWAFLEILAYSAWYMLFPASFILAIRSFLTFSAIFVVVYWATMGRKKEKAD